MFHAKEATIHFGYLICYALGVCVRSGSYDPVPLISCKTADEHTILQEKFISDFLCLCHFFLLCFSLFFSPLLTNIILHIKYRFVWLKFVGI